MLLLLQMNNNKKTEASKQYQLHNNNSNNSAASAASERKSAKYSNVAASHMFYPVAVETLGIFADEAHEFISEIGRRASLSTADPREMTFLYQRISA